MWQYPILIAAKHNIPIIFNCPGVPFSLHQYQNITNHLLNICPYISVRDNESKVNLNYNSRVNVIIDSINIIDNVYPKTYLSQTFSHLNKYAHLEKKYIVLQINNTQAQDEIFIKEINISADENFAG